ncbi:larval cuticle protein A3A-like [Eupeodes corollae]|uniref:larval cuticle protein A3A-like n=1 Tax=Eupeodes corollae TaxID=290404 RepID=UPI002491BAB9|nr:larval cuticle protein A3A-like [Eupeodes corollae]
MAFKFVAFFACLAVASAGYLASPLAAVATPVLAKTEDHDPHPQYSYGYDVQDAISGDSKNQHETRDGDIVHGQYSLNDADGYRRIVDYTADPINGFNAVVRREPLGAAVAVKTVAAAPALIKSAPLAYAAAPAPLYKSTPLTYAAAPTLVKSAHLAYSAAPATTLYQSAPALIRSAPALVRTSYAAPALIKSAPALAYSTGPALVKTSYSSPLISYAY